MSFPDRRRIPCSPWPARCRHGPAYPACAGSRRRGYRCTSPQLPGEPVHFWRPTSGLPRAPARPSRWMPPTTTLHRRRGVRPDGDALALPFEHPLRASGVEIVGRLREGGGENARWTTSCCRPNTLCGCSTMYPRMQPPFRRCSGWRQSRAIKLFAAGCGGARSQPQLRFVRRKCPVITRQFSISLGSGATSP